MKRLLFLGLLPLAVTAAAQTMDHSSMPGMVMPSDSPKTNSGKRSSPVTQSPAEEKQPSSKKAAPAAMDHSSMPGMDHSAMPGMDMPSNGAHMANHSAMPDSKTPSAMPEMAMPNMQQGSQASMPGMDMPGMDMGPKGQPMGQTNVPHSPPPPPPNDHAADHVYSPTAMAAARDELRHEHGGEIVNKVMVNLAEYQVRDGSNGYRWDGQAWYGGDIDRVVLKSEGEGALKEGVESAELQALYSRAIGVYTDVQAGLRQDFNPSTRTYATIGVESLLPYWFEVEGAAFVSNKGEVLGRLEGYYDLLLTNYVVIQPRIELNFAAQNSAETRIGSGLSNAELGLRLRYEITREFAPYIGISWDRKVGQTAGYARTLGQGIENTSFVVGIRTFF